MALTEGARRVYGQPGGDQKTQLGRWYQQYYRGIPANQKIQSSGSSITRVSQPSISRNIRSEKAAIRGASPAKRASRSSRADRTFSGDAARRRMSPEWQAQFKALQQEGILDSEGSFLGDRGYYDPHASLVMEQAAQAAHGLYTEDHARDPGNWATEDIAKLQRQLVKAGILQNKFHLGAFDRETQSAYSDLLAMANDNGGKTKGEMLRQLISSAPDDLSSFFRKPEFLKPDRATLVNDIEGVFRQRLGRSPTANERRDLANYYAQQFRREYRLETVPRAREQFVGQAAGQITGAELTLAGGDPYEAAGFSGGPGEVQDVDPGARVQREFMRRFKNEENMLERREEDEEKQVTATRGFDSLRSMMGAGGVQQLG